MNDLQVVYRAGDVRPRVGRSADVFLIVRQAGDVARFHPLLVATCAVRQRIFSVRRGAFVKVHGMVAWPWQLFRFIRFFSIFGRDRRHLVRRQVLRAIPGAQVLRCRLCVLCLCVYVEGRACFLLHFVRDLFPVVGLRPRRCFPRFSHSVEGVCTYAGDYLFVHGLLLCRVGPE